MNDKKENQGGSGNTERFTKKVAKLSAFVYLGLAILVVVVATVGIFSISYDADTSLPPVSLPQIDFGENSLPAIPDASEAPVINDESGVNAEVSVPVTTPVFVNPITGGTLLKGYSMDALVFSETMRDYRVHSGIDIHAEVGTAVRAHSDGTVLSVTDDYFYGTTVAIQHANGLVSYYMNLAPALVQNVQAGSVVKAGEAFAYVGTTARVESKDAPHLHFELRVNGALIDPTPEIGQ